MFTFLHTADIHLDSPLRGLSRYEGAPANRIRNATREALTALVQAAIDEAVSFVILAGDVFDGDWKDYNTGLFFSNQMARLRRENIPVYMVSGNHDAGSVITRSLKMPENVHTFSTRRPETIILEDPGVAIHGQGFSRKEMTDNLAAAYPDPVPEQFNIGILHTCVDGREGHGNYAPCKLDDLLSKRYDYWALGHVHQREILHTDPWIVFPGNIQGRHIKESGIKGCTLVQVDDTGDTHIDFLPLNSLQWIARVVDCTGISTVEEIIENIISLLVMEQENLPGCLLAVRLDLTGMCSAHAELTKAPLKWAAQIRATVSDMGNDDIWIEKIMINTQMPLDVSKLTAGKNPVAELLAADMAGIQDNAPLIRDCKDVLSLLEARLPVEFFQENEDLDFTRPETLDTLLQKAKNILLPRLLVKGQKS